MDPQPVATPQAAALAALLQRSGRTFVPLRRAFVQDRRPGGGPGPLAEFVTGRRRRALDLYLLCRALASAPPWDVDLPNVVWGRLLGLPPNASGAAITRQWKWLEQHELISSTASSRRRLVVLRDDGSGHPYTHPGLAVHDSPPEGDYFRLPHAYWAAGMQEWADLPTKAVLLIALSLRDDFILPFDKAPAWYGISKDTVRAGVRSLLTRRFLTMRTLTKPAPLTAAGITQERRYTLAGPFVRPADPIESEG